ncbi:SdiA-regulated domain-containing protein [Maribellus comscasis]|nr:SdiA-regulated domain-containing protein [Maribellus comscasis]
MNTFKVRMQLFKNVILLIFLISYGVSNAQELKENELFKNKSYTLPYILNRPNKTWKLPKKLNEISGLSYIDKYRLACIQDEKGNIYIFNLLTGDVERKIDFGDDGDYEAIEIVKNDAWVLKSNGTLYKVNNYLNENEDDVEKYPTILTKKNDAEGLCYYPPSKQLLIACKGHPFVDDKSGKNQKAIYQYDIKTNLLDLDPFLVIRLDFIKDLKNYNTITKWGVELLAYLDDAKGDLTFQPSAIAIHPVTGDIYILASVGNLLMIYSSEKELQCIVQLEAKIHPQPEGICFSPDGTLYISNEGKETSGRISVFTMRNQPLTNDEQ